MAGSGVGDAGKRLPELVLASTSRYRRQLLERLGIPFRCVGPDCDESALQSTMMGFAPRRIAEELAEAKARSVAAAERVATIIACDQLVSFDGQIFGKPGTVDRAIEQLTAMSGRTHELITAVVVVSGSSELIRHTDVTRLSMRVLSRETIERYVALDRPLDCAGSYKLECHGVTLFDRIDTADHTAITGLPLIAITGILLGLGYPIP
jgi:septum formation protein